MDSAKPGELFNAYYYAHDCGEPYQRNQAWLSLFNGFAARIISDIGPETVLDAGCAMGFLVEALRQRNVQAWGIDISEYAIRNVHPDFQPYCQVGSIIEPFPHPRYDLIVCIEVLEHLPAEQAEKAIANLCQHSDDILFSSTPFDYKEATHFNVRPPEFWAEGFARNGFFRDVDFDASFITPWAVRFCRQDKPLVRLVHDYERRLVPLRIENTELRNSALQMRNQLDNLEQELLARRNELANTHEALQQHELLLNKQDAELTELRRKLENIQSSRWWRIFRRLLGQ